MERQNQPEQRPAKRIGGTVSRDTIFNTRTLVAQGKYSDAESIRQKAREVARREQEKKEKRRRQLEAERKKKLAARQRRRELLMFMAVLVLVGVIFLADVLVKKRPEKQQKKLPETAVPAEDAQKEQEEPEKPEEETRSVPLSESLELPPKEPEPEPAPEPEPEPEPEVPFIRENGVGSDVLAEYYGEGIGGKNRRNNLERACESINGLVVQPGEQFSYNNALGQRTAENGYLEASIYTAEDNNLDFGGGICQVSSLLFDCAMRAGMYIDERQAHMYTVSYVDPGMDATVDWGYIDFRFTNTLKDPIEIQAEVLEEGVEVRILGTKPEDFYVEVVTDVVNVYPYETIYQTDYSKSWDYSNWETLPKRGYDVFTYQDFYNASGELIEHRKVSSSYYKKIDLIITVGPN